MPTTTPVGNYTLTVDVRTSAVSATPDASSTFVFGIIAAPAFAVRVTPNVASPHVNGTAITFTAASVGTTAPQYRFNVNGTVVQDYSATATWTMPLLQPAGTYTVTADVRTNTLSATPDVTSAPVTYVLNDARDLNADGIPDLFWQHQLTGGISAWFMNGTAQTSSSWLTPSAVADTNWKIVGYGDFNSDGRPDMVWRNQATGEISVWFMNGTTQASSSYFTPSAVADTNWQIAGIGDFNADGQSDMVWRNQATGGISVWFMNGTTQASSSWLTPSAVADTNWQIAGVGDFNADGKPDILWWNRTMGGISVWFMNGTTQTSSSWLTPSAVADTNWQIAGVGDYNADGKPDILWQNQATGEISVWFMNGTTQASSSYFTPGVVGDTNWKIVGK
jgi:hypothetical protein